MEQPESISKVNGHGCSGAVMLLTLAAFSLVIAGCGVVGPKAVRSNRVDYSEALRQSNDEQLLLNLVRLRYRDTPSFLDVGNITTQLRVEVAAEAGIEQNRELEFGEKRNNLIVTDFYRAGIAGSYSEQPTITFTPLKGEEFIQRFLSPVSLDKIMLLYRSGWSLPKLLRVCVSRMNTLANAPRAGSSTPGKEPRYREFLNAVKIMNDLEDEELLFVGYSTRSGDGGLVLRIDAEGWKRPEARELANLLGLTPGRQEYSIRLMTLGDPPHPETIFLETRSLLGMLAFLSNGVDVPPPDLGAGKVKTTTAAAGGPFDWGAVLGNLFKVASGPARPAGSAVSIRYRNNWFSIDDSDLETKATFMLVSQLFSLQAGKTESVSPLLTLPVGR